MTDARPRGDVLRCTRHGCPLVYQKSTLSGKPTYVCPECIEEIANGFHEALKTTEQIRRVERKAPTAGLLTAIIRGVTALIRALAWVVRHT